MNTSLYTLNLYIWKNMNLFWSPFCIYTSSIEQQHLALRKFKFSSSQIFPSSICRPFSIGDGRFNIGTHADSQIYVWYFPLRRRKTKASKVDGNRYPDKLFFVNNSCHSSLIFEVSLFSWYRQQTIWIVATTEEHSKENDGNSRNSCISVNSSVFFSNFLNAFFSNLRETGDRVTKWHCMYNKLMNDIWCQWVYWYKAFFFTSPCFKPDWV